MSSETGYSNGSLIYNGETITHPNLYVRNLPPNMDQTAVEVLFRRFGSCTGCKFFKTAAVPYAFLRLSTPAEALAAIKAMNGTTVSGRIILVKSADADATYDAPNENLYVRNIPVSWNEEDIRQFFEKFGPLVSVRVLPPISTSVGQVAMVRFQQLEHAQVARDGANATIPHGEHLPLNVKFADNQDEKARKQHSRLVKSTSAGSGPGGHISPSQRYAPYPGASGPPGYPPGMGLPFGPPGMGLMATTESGAMMPPPDIMGPIGMPPPPWAPTDPAAMFGVRPPPPPPPRIQQHPQPRPQQLPPPQQQQQQQPPVLAIAVDAASGQLMLPAAVGPGSPGLMHPPQQQPLPVQVVPMQPVQATPSGQVPPQPAVQPQQQPPRPALQQPKPQQPPQPQPQTAGPQHTGQGVLPQPQPLPGASPGAPPQATHGTYPVPAGAPVPAAAAAPTAPPAYPGYDAQSAQHYAQQPYGAAPYGYPGYPYSQPPAQQQEAYDTQAAAYYAAYYGQPPPSYAAAPGTAATSNVSTTATTSNGDVPGGFKPSCRIMISNLPGGLEKVHMYESFSAYGAILAVHVTNGFGVVQYAERESASRAAVAMNGALLRGTRIKVVIPDS
ncbi:hypothetical protein VOLCADRAFT_107765 [Volvox carteri f. nagariensis]|uniref:RRM domain-containing protein n=1 Tax=Volvox carteri f. nagariensis TaxID=3068 RepID=D8UG83_VOLCA|nr:uncharacterized protein VOLCADRAFT_107765 [Volvox carteri f. nagariensis]EFJ41215.1 hypothetical protein VOLCADRAFT_107765 [Volvox carteri f. nagariensis]|eukprot:XP_002957666.1 hypothetical protein VOLCADRAFT_107765 [Volvox carteri f. nagariensis]